MIVYIRYYVNSKNGKSIKNCLSAIHIKKIEYQFIRIEPGYLL